MSQRRCFYLQLQEKQDPTDEAGRLTGWMKKKKKGQLIHHSLDINAVVLETFQDSTFCSHINTLRVTSLLRKRLLVNSGVEAGSPRRSEPLITALFYDFWRPAAARRHRGTPE